MVLREVVEGVHVLYCISVRPTFSIRSLDVVEVLIPKKNYWPFGDYSSWLLLWVFQIWWFLEILGLLLVGSIIWPIYRYWSWRIGTSGLKHSRTPSKVSFANIFRESTIRLLIHFLRRCYTYLLVIFPLHNLWRGNWLSPLLLGSLNSLFLWYLEHGVFFCAIIILLRIN